MTAWTLKRRKDHALRAHLFVSTARALGVAELLLEVISYLPQADLLDTALVSKAWLRQTQQVLYRSPDLARPAGVPGEDRAWPLLRTLGARPGLGLVVREVTVAADDRFWEDDEERSRGWWMGKKEGLVLLEKLLERCVRVDKIVFQGERGGARGSGRAGQPCGEADGRVRGLAEQE